VKKPTKKELAKLVDELGGLEAEIAPLAAKKARVDQLRAELRRTFEDQPGEKTFALAGEKFTVTIGMKEMQRSIRCMKSLFASVGAEHFVPVATVTLKNVETILRPDQLADFIKTERTGPRPVNTFQKA